MDTLQDNLYYVSKKRKIVNIVLYCYIADNSYRIFARGSLAAYFVVNTANIKLIFIKYYVKKQKENRNECNERDNIPCRLKSLFYLRVTIVKKT